MTTQPDTSDCIAGLVAFQDDDNYYAINVKVESGKLTEVAFEKSSAPARGQNGRGNPGTRGPAQPQPVTPQISEELPELIGMCDRILIMRQGSISAEFKRSPELCEDDLVKAMI